MARVSGAAKARVCDDVSAVLLVWSRAVHRRNFGWFVNHRTQYVQIQYRGELTATFYLFRARLTLLCHLVVWPQPLDETSALWDYCTFSAGMRYFFAPASYYWWLVQGFDLFMKVCL
jgi:hypothetical protein